MNARRWSSCVAAALLASALAACDKAADTRAAPSPSEVLAQAAGYYCGMSLADHEGPKGQIHLASRQAPIWFSSVRDTIAFLRLPEEPRDIAAVYVNDMGKARRWDQPEAGAWVEARNAWFVIDSDRRGGMGTPEAIPFSERAAAQAFRDRHGGRLARLDDIPDAYVLGPVDLSAAPPAQQPPAEAASAERAATTRSVTSPTSPTSPTFPATPATPATPGPRP